MRIQFWMSDMASGNPNWISGHVTKDTQGMDQKQRIFSIKIRDFSSFFDHQKSTRRYVNSIFDVRYGLREKAPRVGFEPTRDFSRPFQGMRQWWLPLRHGRGCGLRGSGSR